jgi:hypothetical protein
MRLRIVGIIACQTEQGGGRENRPTIWTMYSGQDLPGSF